MHAGGDLGPVARWITGRHVSKCEPCREEVAAFESMLEILPELAEPPEVPWSRLAAEMKANIRLGLAAGECVREAAGASGPRVTPWFAGGRAAVACASVVLLLAAGIVLERSSPAPLRGRPFEAQSGVELRATGSGIQRMKDGEPMYGLTSAAVRNVTYSVNAQGSVRARWVDPDTGQVMVNDVYAQ